MASVEASSPSSTGRTSPETEPTQHGTSHPPQLTPEHQGSPTPLQSDRVTGLQESRTKASISESQPIPEQTGSKRQASDNSSAAVPSKKAFVEIPMSNSENRTRGEEQEGTEEDNSNGKGDAEKAHVTHPNPVREHDNTDSAPLDDYETEGKQLPRQWELTEFGAQLETKDGAEASMPDGSRVPVTFTLMSYNVLSQDLLNCHPYLYSGSSSQALDWRYRRRRLLSEIACHNADVLCLQEVQEDHYYEYFKPRLQRIGYKGSYMKRTGDKSDGCATLWKRDKFELLHFEPVRYWRGGLLDRDNVAVIVVLKPLRPTGGPMDGADASEDKVLIANTHLLFNPRRGDIKLAQLMVLLAEIDKHACLGPSARTKPDPDTDPLLSRVGAQQGERYCPVIMTGDFNMQPHCELYKFLVSGSSEYEGLVINTMSGQEEGWQGQTCHLTRHFLSSKFGVTDACQYRYVVSEHERHRQAEEKSREGEAEKSREGEAEKSREGEEEKSRKGEEEKSGEGEAYPCETKNGESGDRQTRDGDEQSDNPSAEQNTNADPSLQTQDTSSNPPSRILHGSGCLHHRLNLLSAYRHKIQRLKGEAEVTTHHTSVDCTVDYILYSVKKKEVCVVEDEEEEEEVEVTGVEEGPLKLIARYGLMSGAEINSAGGMPNSVLPSDHLCLMTKFLIL